MIMAKRILQGMALLGAALCVAAGGRQARVHADAADQGVYTYAALWGVPRGQWGEIEKFYKSAVPTLEKLTASGTLTGWGNARVFVHDETGITHESWITATSFANITRALDAVRTAVPQPAAFATSKHVDELLRATTHGEKLGASGTGLLWVARYEVRPAQMEEIATLFETGIKPLFDEQMAAGTILSYALNYQAVHTGPAGGVSIAYLLPDATAVDKFQAALAAYQGLHPEVGRAMEGTMEYAAHRDFVYEVMNFGQR
jgi:hypothetical protein